MTHDKIYAQGKAFDEFMEWCNPLFGEKCSELYQEKATMVSENNYNFVFITIVIIIVAAVIGNYYWSKRKGRKYSEE